MEPSRLTNDIISYEDVDTANPDNVDVDNINSLNYPYINPQRIDDLKPTHDVDVEFSEDESLEDVVTEVVTVFVFNIKNEIRRRSIYNATRYAWKGTKKFQTLKPSYAVGLVNKVSIGSFEIKQWFPCTTLDKRDYFISPNHPSPTMIKSLLHKNWSRVIEPAKGHWGFGNFLIVQFDCNGHFRIIKGSDPTIWHNC